MSDLKFSCPSCAQHIQCDESFAGDKIPCPKCGTVVRVPTDAPSAIDAPATEPARASGAVSPHVPTLEENFLTDPGAPVPTTPPITKREQEIAAARAAHPMQSAPAVKPRLSFILSGGQAPIAEENRSAMHAEQKPDEGEHAKTLHE